MTELKVEKVTQISQEFLFNETNETGEAIKQLGRFIQNDFRSMLEDNIITKEALGMSIVEMEKSFNDSIVRLQALQQHYITVMTYWANGINHFGDIQ